MRIAEWEKEEVTGRDWPAVECTIVTQWKLGHVNRHLEKKQESDERKMESDSGKTKSRRLSNQSFQKRKERDTSREESKTPRTGPIRIN